MCCRTSSTDTCRSDGLCDSSWDDQTWRVFCTDPTWQAPECVKLCLDSGRDGDGKKIATSLLNGNLTFLSTGNTGGSVRVTPCTDGSYCCGVGSQANSCCVKGNGAFLAKNGQTTDANPSSTASSSTATSSSTIPSPAAAAATGTSQTATGPSAAVTKTTEKTTNNTGAIAGGVVGGLVAAALIVVAAIWFFRRRKSQEAGEKGPWAPYATGSPPGFYSEVEGANARMELPAPVGHEMPAQDYYSPKKHPVHELQ
ncbi:MAG: hypothetical protein Q9168_006971 [Polycauliona sp. 1 TL-2023]